MGAFEKDHGSRSCGHALSIPEAVDTTDANIGFRVLTELLVTTSASRR